MDLFTVIIMKKILFITYYFPPAVGAGVQRPMTLVKNLMQFGVEPIVITVNPDVASYQGTDEGLLREIPARIRVYRTNTNEHYKYYKRFVKKSVPTAGFANESHPSFLQKVARFIRGNFYFPDPRKGWFDFAVAQAEKIIKEENIDIVYTTSPPQSTHLIGLELKRKLGVKWICDLTDPWTDIYYFKKLYHLPFALRMNKRMELDVLEQADQLITCSKNFRELFLKKSTKIKSENFEILYVGYDADHFTNRKSAPSEKSLTITYTGTIADSYNPVAFLRAVKRLADQNIAPLQLRFVGMASDGINDLIKANGLGSLTEFTGMVSHSESINYLMKSTALLLIVPQNENNEGIIPGKIFEYFASQKPILALANPNGDVAELIAENQRGKSFDHAEEDAIYLYLTALAHAWNTNSNLDLNTIDLSRYESRHQAKLLSDAVMKLTK